MLITFLNLLYLQDELSAALIPQKWPDGRNINAAEYRATKTTGNGNCFFVGDHW